VLSLEIGDAVTEKLKLRAALAIFTELNMPRERDWVQSELGGNAASAAAT